MRDLKAKRVVVKIGTNTICQEDGSVDNEYIIDVARQVVQLSDSGVEVIVVTSGAIGSGATELGITGGRPKDIPLKQACAAVGQALLMMSYRDAFSRHGRNVGQVLLTYGAFSDRARYLDLQKAIGEMFRLKVVPIVNENDVISTDEIEEVFGDNDKLSAMVASKMDADLLILLTDVEGLYDRNPQMDLDARLIGTVDEITKDIERIAGGNRSDRSVGGMRTKITAARIAMQSGCNTVIANGQLENVIVRVVAGEEIGTLFTSSSKYNNKQRWILFGSPRGKIVVDDGAERALRSGKSLLPCGIVAVEGRFKEGDLVRIGNFAKGVTNFSDDELLALKLQCLDDKAAGMDRVKNDKVAVNHINMVMLDEV